jgi:hypothetical protein
MAGGGSSSNSSIMNELQELRSQVAKQQAEIDLLKKAKPAVPADMENLKTKVTAQQEHIEALEAKKGFAVSANELINGIKLKGDMRVRYDVRDKEFKAGMGEDLTRERFRSRFRLGGVWDNKAENWQLAAGLATGTDDPRSTNDTWSEVKPFETGDIRLDYAYAKHKWNDFSMALGQMENPYKTSWVFWDSDVRLAGMTLAYGQKEGVFATGGAYGAKLVQDNDTSMLYMGQVGYNGKFSEKGKFTVATGYHVYSNEIIDEEWGLDHDFEKDPAHPATKSSFGLGSVDPNVYELSIGDIYTDVSFPAGPVKLKMYGHIWMNFGADGKIGQSQAGSKFPGLPEDNDMGWVVGTDATINDFKMGLAYTVVEADSLFGYLSDATFGDGLSFTNKKGWKALLGYNFTKNWSTALNYYNYERVEDWTAAKEDNVSVYQIDVNYKF